MFLRLNFFYVIGKARTSELSCPITGRVNYDDDDNDDAGKAIHMFRFCFAGETKTIPYNISGMEESPKKGKETK